MGGKSGAYCQSLLLFHTELDEHAAGGFWVEEADELVVGAGFGGGVEEGEAGGGEALHFGVDVGDFEGDVVHAFAAGFDEFRDDAIGSEALEELDLGVAGAEEGGVDALGFDPFSFVAGGVEKGLVERDAAGEVSDGDADVFDL